MAQSSVSQIAELETVGPECLSRHSGSSKVSWASQVEEEHDAVGWTGLPRESDKEDVIDPISLGKLNKIEKKSKKKKKKKAKDTASPKSDVLLDDDGNDVVQEVVVEAVSVKAAEILSQDSSASSTIDAKCDVLSGTNKIVGDVSCDVLSGISQIVGVNMINTKDYGMSEWEVAGRKGKRSQGFASNHEKELSKVPLVTNPGSSQSNGRSKLQNPSHGYANATWEHPTCEAPEFRRAAAMPEKLPGRGVGSKPKPFYGRAPDVSQKDSRQRSGDWDRGRVPVNGNNSKGGRSGAKVLQGSRSFPTRQSLQVAPVGWGQPEPQSIPSGWDISPPKECLLNAAPSSSNGGRVPATGLLEKLLPPERGYRSSTATAVSPSAAPDTRGNQVCPPPAPAAYRSSLFEEYPASTYSDSNCSDDQFDSDSASLASLDSGEESDKSHGTRKNTRWFRTFFQELDLLTEDQLQEYDRQWHCPACHGGVGAIDWYRGIQPLLAHARTVRSKRVKLHKEFVELLEEDIRVRGASAGTQGSGKYGKWKALGEDTACHKLIVWPPMVVIQNTLLMQDEQDKWLGMGNRELLDLFKDHNPLKAKHAYGPTGHKGMSILIFSDSPTGYYHAQRLDERFKDLHRGRDNWDSVGKKLFEYVDRILYGYMANSADLESFNKHSRGKTVLKSESKTFYEMVLCPMLKTDRDRNQMLYLQGKVEREIAHSKVLEKTMGVMTKKLHLREEELIVIRSRAKEQHRRQETEMEDLEDLYRNKLAMKKVEFQELEECRRNELREFEIMELQHCEKLEEQVSNIPKDKLLTSNEKQKHEAFVKREIERHSKLLELSINTQKDLETKLAEIWQEHHQRLMALKSQQFQELLDVEKELERERLKVLESFDLPNLHEMAKK